MTRNVLALTQRELRSTFFSPAPTFRSRLCSAVLPSVRRPSPAPILMRTSTGTSSFKRTSQ